MLTQNSASDSNSKPWQRRVAWALIAALANPATVVPLSVYSSAAYARDTEIYQNTNNALSTAEPAIMLILDTSDSMNVPEPWREYDPDVYDSHAEYLWNSPNYMATVSTLDPAGGLSTAGSSGATFVSGANSNTTANTRTMRYDSGWWSRKGFDGNTLTGTNLRDAALAYADGTNSSSTIPAVVDPGARKLYRNYAYSDTSGWRGGGMFLYWTPLDGRDPIDPTIETDPRLRSDSFNKLWGTASVTNYGNTATTDPMMRGGIMFGKTPTNGADPYVDYRHLNQCGASLDSLQPSTIYAPSATPRNSGKMLNQEWLRWGRYQGLNDTLAGFGNSDLNTAGFRGADTLTGAYYNGYLGQQRDSNTLGNCDALPVRTRIDSGTTGALDAGDSYAGWTNLAADYGGYTFFLNRVGSEYGGNTCSGSTNSNTQLENAIRIYYPNATTHPVGSNLGAAASYFKKYFPVPEYYDVPGTVSVTSGGSSGTTITKTRTCTASGRSGPFFDAKNVSFAYGGSCAMPAADANCNDQTGNCKCSSSDSAACALVADPSACGLASNATTFYTKDNLSCSWLNHNSVAKDNKNCAWSGRQTKVVEGVGTYYYGGACTGVCAGALCDAPTGGGENYCNKSTSGTITISGTTMTDYRTDSPTAGCTNKSDQTLWHGGTCQGTISSANSPYTAAPTSATAQTAACNMTATASTTINGTTYYNTTTTAGGNCADKSDVPSTCAATLGTACTVCTNQTASATVGASAGSTTTYNVFNRTTGDSMYTFDCKADDGTSSNPGSGYLRNSATLPSAFNTAYNSSSTASNNNNSYSTNSAHAVPSAPPINVYHPNYLNWKFGAKACRKADDSLITSAADLGSAVTCRPIARKTRLQIAKDALSTLVSNTNGVRFGLTVFNKMATDFSSEGGNVAYAIRRMGNSTLDPDYANRAVLISKIDAITATARTPLTETVYEAYRYFRGEAPLYGALSTAAKGGGTITDGRDTAAVSAGKYISPMISNPNTTDPAACQKNYIVLVTDGGPEDDYSANGLVSGLSQGPYVPYMPSVVTTAQIPPQTTPATPTTQLEISTGVPYGPTDLALPSNYIWLDELTYYMANTDMSPGGGATGTDVIPGIQSVNTYTIGFAGGNTEVLINAANKGKGQNKTAEDSASLSAALSDAIVAIRDWNPTVAAPTVPISALNRTQSSDYAYLSFFGPKLQQRWDGTVKKFKVSTDTSLCGDDADGNPINYCLTGLSSFGSVKNIDEYTLDPLTLQRTAKIRDNAVSYWGDIASPDGGKPNAGGTCYVTKTAPGSTPVARKVYTHISGNIDTALTSASNAMSEANALITKGLLGNATMSDAARSSIINFGRGGDPADPNCVDSDTATACTAWRSWPHGDVLHSQPIVLTYNVIPDSDPLVDADGDGDPTNDRTQLDYLFYMSNDGFLHAVEALSGEEKWSFMPEESLAQLKGIMDNSIGEHIIAGDGSPTLYVQDVNGDNEITSADKAYLFFGMRRGGRVMYALDVSDRNAPKLMWKISNSTTGFSELGETWSTPDIAKLRTTTDPVLVFGAGYDAKANDLLTVSIARSGTTATVATEVDHGYLTGEIVEVTVADNAAYNGNKTITVTGARTFTFTVSGSPPTPATTTTKIKVSNPQPATMGRGVFFVNARTGDLIKSFTKATVPAMDYSMPSDVLVLNTDLDSLGYADRLYLGDLGGNVWRIDFDDANPVNWKAINFADLTGSSTLRRKIFFPPAVVKQEYLGQRFDAIYVGTGDRENPLRTDNADKMFMIKDLATGLSTTQTTPIVFSTTDFYDLSDNLVQFGDSTQQAAAQAAIKAGNGWFMNLNVDSLAGEKVVNAPSVFSNVLRFGTYSPRAASSPCFPAGKGTEYAMSALDGSVVVDTNRDDKIDILDKRITSNASLRGFPSSGTIVIRDGKVWLHSVTDGVTKGERIGTIGGAQRAYWFQEPER